MASTFEQRKWLDVTEPRGQSVVSLSFSPASSRPKPVPAVTPRVAEAGSARPVPGEGALGRQAARGRGRRAPRSFQRQKHRAEEGSVLSAQCMSRLKIPQYSQPRKTFFSMIHLSPKRRSQPVTAVGRDVLRKAPAHPVELGWLERGCPCPPVDSAVPGVKFTQKSGY